MVFSSCLRQNDCAATEEHAGRVYCIHKSDPFLQVAIMAIKKTEHYSSLDRSTNKIRGGMDASLCKNYILKMLFLKYVTDTYFDKKFARVRVSEGGNFEYINQLRKKDEIGERIDESIQRLSEANDGLTGLFADAHFIDDDKFGVSKEKKKLTDIGDIICRPGVDLKNNKEGGDNSIGDSYEYLMHKYVVEGEKSKSQFYSPGEISRIMAGLLGISDIHSRPAGWSIHDPACGSASLLFRAASEANCPEAIYGQKMEITTAAFSKMNLIIYTQTMGEVRTGKVRI